MEAVAHKVSFVTGGQLREFQFFATTGEADAFLDAIPHEAKSEVSDFQVFATGTSDPRTCTELAGDMADAATPPVVTHSAETAARLDAMHAAAAAVDAAAAATPPENLVTWTASLVWENGGGNDNAFEEAFRGPAHHPAITDFATAMETAMSEFAYDIGLAVVPGPTPDETLETAVQEMVGVLEEEECESLAYAVRQALPANAPAP